MTIKPFVPVRHRAADKLRIVRKAGVSLPTAKQRSRTVVLSSQKPVMRVDDRGQPYREVLLSAGVEFRLVGKKTPLLYGTGETVRNIIGSIREIRIDRGQVLGDVYFASDRAAKEVERQYQSGALSRITVTSIPFELISIPIGVTWKGIEGPAEVVTRWQIAHASILP